jgi:hypothetical protein
MLEIFICLVVIAGMVIALVFNTRYRQHPWDSFYPKLAWMRAGMYFCFCWTLSYLSGGLELILTSPIVTQVQLQNANWWIYTCCAAVFIVSAYSVLWCYYTPVFKRKKNMLVSALFGFLWGSSSGQLFLSIWLIVGTFGLSTLWVGIVTFGILAMYQPNWHNIYWDHYIAPEHDTPMTQVIKATCCHIPNLLIMLPYLSYYENYALFVGAQVIACVSAGLGMRYPSPWAEPSKLNYAHRTAARLPRCTGYIVDDYKTDPYTPFYRGWTGPEKRS